MAAILLLGANGQVAHYLRKYLQLEHSVTCLTRNELDVSKSGFASEIAGYHPDLVINATAYTAVDKAESELELARTINANAPHQIALVCEDLSIPFIHYSTDYVFSGEADRPYNEDDETDPQSVYGQTKLEGELAVLSTAAQAYIFRTSWVYSRQGANFYKSMLRLAQEREQLGIVADQVGGPTYAGSIAFATVEVIRELLNESAGTIPAGVYHMTCQGQTSWCDFAKAIFELNDVQDIQVNPLTTSEYPTPAKRPAYSVLDNQKLHDLFNISLPSWQDALQLCVAEDVS